MQELFNTLVIWVKAVSGYRMTDFFAFITAILQTFGFPGQFVGPESMAEVADWIVDLLGPLGSLYTIVVNLPKTDQFIEIVNKILAFLNR